MSNRVQVPLTGKNIGDDNDDLDDDDDFVTLE